MKRLAIGLGTAIAGALGLAFVAPSFIDWDAYKPRIVAEGEAALGRRIAIDGKVSVRLLPQPTAEARGVRLGNLAGGSEPDMARVESIGLRIAILPLLVGRIEVGSVRVVRPEILLETLADGRTNWTFARPAAAGEVKPGDPAAAQPGGAGGGSPRAVALDDVRIEGGRLTYRDARQGSVETVDAIDLRFSAGSLDGPFTVNGTATLRGQAIAIEGQTGTLGAGMAPLRASLKLPQAGLAARLDGTATLAPEPRLNGRLLVDVASPSALAAVFGASMPVTKPIALGTRVEGSADSIAFNDIEVKLGDAVINGAARLEGGARWRGDILLVAGRIDLDALIAKDLPAPTPARGAALPAPIRSASAPVPVAGGPAVGAAAKPAAGFALPRDIEIAADIGIDALVYNREASRDVKLIGLLHDGVFDLERASARLPGDARLAVSGRLTAANGEPHFRGRVDASADSLRDTARALGAAVDAVPGESLRRFAWRSAIEADSDEIRLAQIDASIDASRVTGSLAFKGGARPKVDVALVVDRLDLDAYLPAEAKSQSAAAPPPPRQAQPAALPAGSPFDALLQADLDLSADLKVGRLGYGSVVIRDTHVDLDLGQGALTVRRATVADLGGASLDAKGVLGLRSTDLTLSARAATTAGLFRLAGIDPPVPPERLGALALDASLTGTLADLALAARLGAAGATIELKGRAGLAGAPAYAFDLSTTHPELGRLIGVFAPGYRPRAGTLGPGALSGRIAGGADKVELSGLALQVGPAAMTGSIVVRFDGPRPHVSADLAAGEIVIDRFLPAERRASIDPHVRLADASPAPIQLAQAAFGRWSAVPMDWSVLRSIDAAVKVKAEALAYQSIRLTRMDAAATLADGVLDLGRVAGGLWGGSVDGRARLDAKTLPRISLDLRVDKARLQEAGLMSDDGLGVSAGIASIVAAFGAGGASEAALVRSLAGKAALDVTNGVLNGINLRAISDRLKRIDQVTDLIGLAQAGVGGGNTPFSSLTGTFVAEGGVVRSADLKLVADAAAGDGVATIDLPAWTLQSRSLFRLVEHPNAPALGVRFEGALDKPRGFTETDALQQYQIQMGAGRLQKYEDRLRGFLRGIGR